MTRPTSALGDERLGGGSLQFVVTRDEPDDDIRINGAILQFHGGSFAST
jgi:hypothetical protein